MARFIVVRRGSNAANQSMCDRRVLGTVEAYDRAAAEAAARDRWTIYNNQWFEFIDLAGRTRKLDLHAALLADAESAACDAAGDGS